MPEYRDYKIRLDTNFEKKLDSIAKTSKPMEADSRDEVLRRAVALYSYLHDKVDNSGYHVAIVDKGDKVIEVIEELP